MIPSVLCGQLKKGLEDYIETTFPISNPIFKNMVKDLLMKPGKVFHDPYVSIKLPFRKSGNSKEWFQSVKLDFPPYVHQEKAYERLLGEEPKSTLVATGTGSGKTECFLYPILEYCYQHRGETGIKAILIYPMNALASDQARRLASIIHKNEELKTNVSAGMFVGDSEENRCKVMDEFRLITDRDVLRTNPPDILLTNYKMLDYLLIRPNDAKLWMNNKPETLKFIVVDELHTFDGAQGTDLAMLLRRLKARLFVPEDYICSIGTSATMGSADTAKAIVDYAQDVFGEKFEETSVITESRLSPSEFLNELPAEYMSIPDESELKKLAEIAEGEDDENAYLKEAYHSWFGESIKTEELIENTFRIDLGTKLKKLSFFRDLIEETRSDTLDYGDIIERLSNRYITLKKRIDLDNRSIVDSLLGLISHARTSIEGVDGVIPFMQVHVQLWFRELRRMVASVTNVSPELAMSDDLNDQQRKKYLPVINCRDCGATGWTAMQSENGQVGIVDMTLFYNAFFNNDKKITMLFPLEDKEESHTSPYTVNLCTNCLFLDLDASRRKCYNCGSENHIHVFKPNLSSAHDIEGKHKGYECPFCFSSGGLSLLGAQSATLTSAGVSQIFASKFNDDKKLLAFSDSVQDASHRAGFFNARTWKFNLRCAIQKYISVSNQKKDNDLESFAKEFSGYWLSKMDRETFIATFIAPNILWRSVFEDMLKNGVLGDKEDEINFLLEDIKKRLELEIYYEFGFNARIGRSLEKSGVSMVYIEDSVVNAICDRAHERIINEIGDCLRNFEPAKTRKLVESFITRIKNNGAIYKSIFDGFIGKGGDTYLLTNDWKRKVLWLPGLSAGRKAPKFLAEGKIASRGRNRFDIITPRSWYYKWLITLIDLPVIREDAPIQLYRILIEEMLKSGVLIEKKTAQGVSVWGLAPGLLNISDKVVQVRCEVCGHSLSISEKAQLVWQNMPCHNNECDGMYFLSKSGRDFYGRLYTNGDVFRIFAHEHTGLLTSEERQKVENEFKAPKELHKPWYPSLLSCTPTLEMGIDIGDLSTVVLCSVPPGQAQFFQRIGRAGRRDGNALSAVVVNASQHDLYFFEEPKEMIAGNIAPPGVFLDASAVLERQFVAYGFDSWVKVGTTATSIPKTIDQVLTNIAGKKKDKFPYNYLNYIENNLVSLIKGFLELVEGSLTDESKRQLKNFSHGEGTKESPLACKIIESFENIHKERESIKKDSSRLMEKIKTLESKPSDISRDEELKMLKRERSALNGIIVMINKKDVFNFLSDEGLLPNYAFPEAGIVLKALIYRKIEKEIDIDQENHHEGGKKYFHYVYEYNRPAASAISEFAPDNSFYASGRKMRIDQIDMNISKPEPWRLCPSCSHTQHEVAGKDCAACPNCADTGWADKGQVRQMLRLKLVYANDEYVRSKSGDESDDRSQTFFCKQMLVDVDDEKDITHAYKINDDASPFGFEFVKKATLREINFGEKDTIGEKVSIAGKELVRKGFKICKSCGMVQKNFKSSNEKAVHSFSCPSRNKESNNNFEECLYLYRDFVSEAIRILIPATSFDGSETRLQSFVASLMLGLKKHFGSVEHLRVCVCEEPLKDSTFRKNYLVLYDSVPGGTGYLKQLMRSEKPMMEVLEKAYEAIKSCSCGEAQGKDGCYRCLFAYKQSRFIGNISRNTAMELLLSIIKFKDKIVEIKSIDEIAVNSILDSELERRFLEAIKRSSSGERTIELNEIIVNYKKGYYLKIGEKSWEIEPQVELSASDGVCIKTRADFVIRPVRNKDRNVRPIAIYTDGYVYHKEQVGSDMAKRMAITRSGNYYVWSLSWKDVENVFQSQGDYHTNFLSCEKMPNGNSYNEFARVYDVCGLKPSSENSLDMLIRYLNQPEKYSDFIIHSFITSLCLCDVAKFGDEEAFKSWKDEIKESMQYIIPNIDSFKFGEHFYGSFTESTKDSNVVLYSAVSKNDLANYKKENSTIIAVLEDRLDMRSKSYEADWNGFLRAYNCLQFMPDCYFVTQKGIEENIYSFLMNLDSDRDTDTSNALGADSEATRSGAGYGWKAAYIEIYDEEILKIAKKLEENGAPPPDYIGYELCNQSGEIVSEAELAWEHKKVVILRSDQVDFSENFELFGWIVYSVGEEIASEVARCLENR